MACANNVCIQPTAGVGGGTSANTSTTGGATGATTVAACTNTLTDANNCGRCGHVCKSGTCTNGVCGAALSDCVAPPVQFANCTALFASFGQTFVAAGCVGDTLWEWDTQAGCDTKASSGFFSARPQCSETIPNASTAYIRCCCTDN